MNENTNHQKRCPFKYYSSTNPISQLDDNRCVLNEGYIGNHIKREILPPPQQYPKEGWHLE